MIILENTKDNQDIRNAVASMAIENMFFDEDFIMELVKVSKGEKTDEEMIREIKQEYGR